MTEWAPERKEQDYYSYRASYVIVGTAFFVTCVRVHASGEAPDLSNRAYFVASGLGFGQEKCYRRLWYRVIHTYPFCISSYNRVHWNNIRYLTMCSV